MRKLVIALVLVIAVVLLWVAVGGRVNGDNLAGFVASAQAWRDGAPLVFAALFFLGYVAVAALSLPLAVWMTLAAGALFGFGGGLILVSFASTIGAT